MNLQEILSQTTSRWKSCVGAQAPLLKLSVLRDLYRQLHALKSHVLAGDDATNLQVLDTWTERVRSLINTECPTSDLMEALAPNAPLKKVNRSIPISFFEATPELTPAKLERKDRDWEKAIAGEALLQKWKFLALDARIPLHEAEEWHHQIIASLWPNGVFLFAEALASDKLAGMWHGRWFFVTKPDFEPPTFADKQGSWKVLFPRS